MWQRYGITWNYKSDMIFFYISDFIFIYIFIIYTVTKVLDFTIRSLY